VGCPKDSSLSWQNFVLLSEGVPLELGRQIGVPPKRRYFDAIGFIVWKRLQIGTELLHIITSTGDRLFRFVNIDVLEWSLTLHHSPPQKNVFIVNFPQFLAAAHISTVSCDEVAEDRQRQTAYENFSIKRRF